MMRLFFSLIISLLFLEAAAQSTRIKTNETIGWYNCFGSFKITNKLGIHAEYQWRRNDLITSWQQSLLRAGINYHVSPRVLFRIGYGWIETFPYGEIPINGFGKQFTEHRIFQMCQLSHKEGVLDLSHRFMLEQRFVGRFSSAKLESEDEFPFVNRIRYLLRLQAPLDGSEIKAKTFFIAAYDELFIGFGKNVAANVFDQNRIGVLLGYVLNENLRLEAGYLSQIVQFGRLVKGGNVFQYNNGLIVNTNFTFDLSKANN